jgi:hypothetical protein
MIFFEPFEFNLIRVHFNGEVNMHVWGHQDIMKSINQLNWWEIHNIEMDSQREATPIISCRCYSHLALRRWAWFYTSKTAFQTADGLLLAVLTAILSISGCVHIDWDILASASHKESPGFCHWVTRHVNVICSVGKRLHH